MSAEKIKFYRQRISRLWRDGQISRNERDFAFKILDSSLVDTMDEETLLWLLYRAISFPVSFAVYSDGLGIKPKDFGGSHE